MTNGTRHDPCIPRHWAMRCPAWTSTRTSHNRVVNKIQPNTDVASISSVFHLVWPLAQSLSSMVVPTRSQDSSWHSLWDLRGTQAPQLRQSNNTLGGLSSKDGAVIWESFGQLAASRLTILEMAVCFIFIYCGQPYVRSTCTIFTFFFKTWTVVCNNLRLMIRKLKVHDDTKWKRFPRYWPYVRGIHRSAVNSPHKGQWRGALNFYLICSWINGWVNNGEAGDLRRHGAHYNVTVMIYHEIFVIHPDHNEHGAVWKLFGQNSIRTVSHHHTKFQRAWPVIRYFSFGISAREAMCMWHLTLCICTSKLFLYIGHLTIMPKQKLFLEHNATMKEYPKYKG